MVIEGIGVPGLLKWFPSISIGEAKNIVFQYVNICKKNHYVNDKKRAPPSTSYFKLINDL